MWSQWRDYSHPEQLCTVSDLIGRHQQYTAACASRDAYLRNPEPPLVRIPNLIDYGDQECLPIEYIVQRGDLFDLRLNIGVSALHDILGCVAKSISIADAIDAMLPILFMSELGVATSEKYGGYDSPGNDSRAIALGSYLLNQYLPLNLRVPLSKRQLAHQSRRTLLSSASSSNRRPDASEQPPSLAPRPL